MIPITQIIEHPQNPNKHSDKQIELLAKILNYQGWRHPLVVSTLSGHLVAGHARLAAAKLNGWTEVPVDMQKFDDKSQEIAFLISDNKISELAEHDDEMMVSLIKELELPDGFELDLFGVEDLLLHSLDENVDEKPESEKPMEFKVEVLCVSSEEMTALCEELTGRGMIVKAKFNG